MIPALGSLATRPSFNRFLQAIVRCARSPSVLVIEVQMMAGCVNTERLHVRISCAREAHLEFTDSPGVC